MTEKTVKRTSPRSRGLPSFNTIVVILLVLSFGSCLAYNAYAYYTTGKLPAVASIIGELSTKIQLDDYYIFNGYYPVKEDLSAFNACAIGNGPTSCAGDACATCICPDVCRALDKPIMVLDKQSDTGFRCLCADKLSDVIDTTKEVRPDYLSIGWTRIETNGKVWEKMNQWKRLLPDPNGDDLKTKFGAGGLFPYGHLEWTANATHKIYIGSETGTPGHSAIYVRSAESTLGDGQTADDTAFLNFDQTVLDDGFYLTPQESSEGMYVAQTDNTTQLALSDAAIRFQISDQYQEEQAGFMIGNEGLTSVAAVTLPAEGAEAPDLSLRMRNQPATGNESTEGQIFIFSLDAQSGSDLSVKVRANFCGIPGNESFCGDLPIAYWEVDPDTQIISLGPTGTVFSILPVSAT